MSYALKSSVSAAILASFVAAPALAADAYYPSSSKDAPASYSEGVFNWSGVYIGVQGGHLNTVIGAEDGSGGLATAGFVGGGRVGFDVARGRTLFGVFGEYNFSNASLEAGGLSFLEKDDEWTVGARLGYIVAPRTLLYVLGGYTQADFSSAVFDDSITLDGATFGGGVEFALVQNVTLGLEAKHTIFIDDVLEDSEIDVDDTAIMGVLRFKMNADLPSLGF